jgi:hypothetical protein
MSSVPNSAADKSLILGELEIEKATVGKMGVRPNSHRTGFVA